MLDMTVTFRTIEDSNWYENQYSLPHFQSWRISKKVFIPHPRAMTAGSIAYFGYTIREICNVDANIRNIVNANQGWTIAG